MDLPLHDLRYAARGLRRSWWFASVTVLTLALGVGVVTALFAVVRAVLLHPIVADQDRVVRIWKQDVERGAFRHSFTYHEFRAYGEQTRSLGTLAAIQYADAGGVAITVGDRPTAVALTPVSADFFALLDGVRPLHGRWFQAADEANGAELVAVVSERFWRRAVAGDPAFVGRRLQMSGGARMLVVVGIAPAELDYPLGTDFWVPIAGFFDGDAGRFDFEDRRFAQFELLGRLAPGASPEDARAELQVLQLRQSGQFPDDYKPMRIVVQPLLDSVVGNSRQVLLFLFAAAGLVLAIAGVNAAALLLMRAASRRRELAVRLALGASHARLARQTVTESLLLGTLSAALGVVFAQLFLGIARWLAPSDVPRMGSSNALVVPHVGCPHRSGTRVQ